MLRQDKTREEGPATDTGFVRRPEIIGRLEYADFGGGIRVRRTWRLDTESPAIAKDLRTVLRAKGTGRNVDTEIAALDVRVHSIECDTARGEEPKARRNGGSALVRITFEFGGVPDLFIFEIESWAFLRLIHSLEIPRMCAWATLTLTRGDDGITRPGMAFHAHQQLIATQPTSPDR